MIEVRAAIEEVRSQAEDEAYWRALEKVLGGVTARTLRATLRTKPQPHAGTEKDRVSREFSALLGRSARVVEDLAKKESTVQGPHPREPVIQGLGLHEHWIDFSDPREETSRIIPFVERALSRGAKVVALVPSEGMGAYRREIDRSDLAERLETGQVSILAADEHVDSLKTSGVLGVVLRAIQGLIEGAREEGYPEVWFVSKIAASLLGVSPTYADLGLRFELALDGLIRSFPISVFCPFPDQLPGNAGMVSDLVYAQTWASVADTALAFRPGRP